jgi:hypothetical protein
MTLPRLGLVAAAAVLLASAVCTVAKPLGKASAQESAAPKSPLDYQVYKSRVEPIFLKKRADHARCYACHSENGSAFHLQKLSPGQTTWTEEQSLLNFASVRRLVNPGDPSSSRLLLHPLAPESGGESYHSGGRQFENQNDPDWKTIAEWVRTVKAGS